MTDTRSRPLLVETWSRSQAPPRYAGSSPAAG